MSDKFARVLTGLAVLAVAVIAAIVSFSHIETLALSHGQPIWDARFLPVSVDGLLVVSSLTLLADARARRPAPGLARAGLVLGVIATVAANVVFGVHAGPVGAIISAWPAVAFIISTEILVAQMRRAGTTPAVPEAIEAVADGVTRDVPGVVGSVARNVPDVEPQKHVSTARPSTSGTVTSGRAHHASKHASKAPARVFAAEISAGELPSLRAVKARLHVGTDRARVIRDELAAILQEAEPEVA